jgi:hypothetical protein
MEREIRYFTTDDGVRIAYTVEGAALRFGQSNDVESADND